MALYEFCCDDCKEEYSELVKELDKTGAYEGVVCPKCGSGKKTKLMSGFAFKFSNPVGTDRWNSEGGGHDYRFKHNIPKVQQERKMAEALSHMGSDPYGDTSASDINLDTGIHNPEFRPGLT